MITDLLNKFNPDGDVLMRAISAHVTDEMLEYISQADYGEDADLHFAAVRQIRDTGVMPQNPGWVPMEVLELIRWSEPEDPNWKPGKTGEEGHWMRGFSCAALLRAECKPGSYHDDPGRASTTVQLILSLDALPLELDREAARHFAWLILKSDPEGKNDSLREFGLALLWFALHLKPVVPDEDLIALAQWLVRRADEVSWDPRLKEFPGLKAMVIRCQKRPGWEIFGVKLAELDLSKRSPNLQTWVRLIAEQLVD